MTKRVSLAAVLAAGVLGAAGCSDDEKKGEPRLAPGTTADPRIGPEQADDVSSSQGSVKGD